MANSIQDRDQLMNSKKWLVVSFEDLWKMILW